MRQSPMTDILAAANTIATARRTPLQPLASDAAPKTEAEGYRIQEALRDLLAADFGTLGNRCP
jgi:2-keto-4-pentenoate hydratase